ncbi:MAG: hypothetical protein ACRD3C_01670 [Vicinamibacterales bacterium]
MNPLARLRLRPPSMWLRRRLNPGEVLRTVAAERWLARSVLGKSSMLGRRSGTRRKGADVKAR